jgi:uncharacterized protein (DUF427 family)
VGILRAFVARMAETPAAVSLKELAVSLTPDQDTNAALERSDAMKEEHPVTVKSIKVPGRDHPISIERNPHRVVVSVAGRVVVDTRNALTLRESTYAPVHYIPRQDVDMSLLERTGHTTYCPYKGDCGYFSIPGGGERSINAVWSYEDPHPAVRSIKDHLAFYPNRVDAIEERSD